VTAISYTPGPVQSLTIATNLYHFALFNHVDHPVLHLLQVDQPHLVQLDGRKSAFSFPLHQPIDRASGDLQVFGKIRDGHYSRSHIQPGRVQRTKAATLEIHRADGRTHRLAFKTGISAKSGGLRSQVGSARSAQASALPVPGIRDSTDRIAAFPMIRRNNPHHKVSSDLTNRGPHSDYGLQMTGK
jgi:hypothetical protein